LKVPGLACTRRAGERALKAPDLAAIVNRVKLSPASKVPDGLAAKSVLPQQVASVSPIPSAKVHFFQMFLQN
jgi:hypothetical protein